MDGTVHWEKSRLPFPAAKQCQGIARNDGGEHPKNPADFPFFINSLSFAPQHSRKDTLSITVP
jgi:hypothetical protein